MTNEYKANENILSEEEILQVIHDDPASFLSFELTEAHCLAAVKKEALLLYYVPDELQTEEMCLAAVKKNGFALWFVSEQFRTLQVCIEAVKSNRHWAMSFVPTSIRGAVLEAMLTNVEGTNNCSPFGITAVKQTSAGCEEAVKQDGLALKDIDLTKISTEGTYINSTLLNDNELYDDSFYKIITGKSNGTSYLPHPVDEDIIPPHMLIHDADNFSYNEPTQRKIFYLSDLHLNHRLLQAFPERASEQDIWQYIKDLIQGMRNHITPSRKDYLLIAGDVSFNFELAKMFYKCLVNAIGIPPSNIIITLGNHELLDWNDTTQTPARDLIRIIDAYKKLCNELGIRFLHNDLFLLDEYGTFGKYASRVSTPLIIRENRLKDMDPDEIRKLCSSSSLIILGGLGFSGLAPKYNATAGLYGQNVQSLEEDIYQSKRFEKVYLNVQEALRNQPVIVLTHTPKSNWTGTEYNPNWIYVSGHTHRNEFCCSEEKTIYADNQIGYDGSTPVYLKHFCLTTNFDIFREYPDGIYTITHDEYNDFNCGQNIECAFSRDNGTIHMLKRNGIYCFMFHNSKTNVYYLLNGGQLRKLTVNSLEYYYDKMIYYYYAMESIFEKYHRGLEKISECIKKIGGTGTIHGCIVDVDEVRWGQISSHIFVNPFDGALTFYSASSICDKWVYESFDALLQAECPALFDNYKQLLPAGKANMLVPRVDVSSSEIAEFVPETYMYKPSRIMRAIQYMKDVHVIRIWSDKVVEAYEKQNITHTLLEGAKLIGG